MTKKNHGGKKIAIITEADLHGVAEPNVEYLTRLANFIEYNLGLSKPSEPR